MAEKISQKDEKESLRGITENLAKNKYNKMLGGKAK